MLYLYNQPLRYDFIQAIFTITPQYFILTKKRWEKSLVKYLQLVTANIQRLKETDKT